MRFRVAALLAAGGLASGACRHPLRTMDLVWDRRPGVVYAVATDAAQVALTVDDGPDAAGTAAILDTLARHGARATFFLLGERVAGQEALVRRIVAAGNEIGNHGMREEPAIDLPPDAFEREVIEARQRLAPFGASCWFRPGSAWYDEAMLEVLARHGYRLALGSSYPLDAQLPFPRLASWWLRVDAEPGEVIVLHDGAERGPRTAEVLERLLPALARKRLAVVTLSELVATSREGIGIGCPPAGGGDS
jgi:peptidoglycan/xylan/chitin deacetylase (PgdA/CDA1 family)